MTATPLSTITGATSTFDTDLLAVAGVGLGIGATLFVVKKGWNLVRNFAR